MYVCSAGGRGTFMDDRHPLYAFYTAKNERKMAPNDL